jgi:hypothetical protein
MSAAGAILNVTAVASIVGASAQRGDLSDLELRRLNRQLRFNVRHDRRGRSGRFETRGPTAQQRLPSARDC